MRSILSTSSTMELTLQSKMNFLHKEHIWHALIKSYLMTQNKIQNLILITNMTIENRIRSLTFNK